MMSKQKSKFLNMHLKAAYNYLKKASIYIFFNYIFAYVLYLIQTCNMLSSKIMCFFKFGNQSTVVMSCRYHKIYFQYSNFIISPR